MPNKILRWPKQRPFLNLTSKLDKNQKKMFKFVNQNEKLGMNREDFNIK